MALKISHPWWNNSGKTQCEARVLKGLHSLGLPCPPLLHCSPPSPTAPAMDDPTVDRAKWFLSEKNREKERENYEFLLMEFVEGENLAALWLSLSWEERKVYITETVEYLAKLKHLRYPHLGGFTDDSLTQIDFRMVDETDPRFYEQFSSSNPIRSWKQVAEWHLNSTLQYEPIRVPKVLKLLAETEDKCPITFTLGDVGPKNLLVKDGKIVSFLDFEWCGPGFLGHDYLEMDYEGAPNNESFTDCEGVSYLEQSEFVKEKWREFGTGVDFEASLMREKICAFSKRCYDHYLKEEKMTEVDKAYEKLFPGENEN